MKKRSLFAGIATCLVSLATLPPALAAGQGYDVLEKGEHHRVLGYVESFTNAVGRVGIRTNSYVELETGLHYRANGEWRESKELIESCPGGAVAAHGPNRVEFANTLAGSDASIKITTPSGQVLRCAIMGLAYYDASTGTNVLIAEVRDSQGFIQNGNRVIYTNAFTDLAADVRYSYTKSGVEQDVILNQQPPAPQEYGLNPETCSLQVWTEFVDAPVAQTRGLGKKRQAKNGLEDSEIEFGDLKLGKSKAFSLPVGPNSKELKVDKQWLNIANRKFLVEQLSAAEVRKQCENLQKAPRVSLKSKGDSSRLFAGNDLPFRKRSNQAAKPSPMLLAQNDVDSGFVLDFVTLLPASFTNYVFKTDTTYYIKGAVYLAGKTVFESGSILKYQSNAFLSLAQNSTGPACTFPSAQYSRVLFTARDDNTVGETITNSTGVISGYYANPAIRLDYTSYGTTPGHDIHNLRVAFANVAVDVQNYATVRLNNFQAVHCGTVFTGDYYLTLVNALVNWANTLFMPSLSGGSTATVFNGTFSGINTLMEDPGIEEVSCWLYNCILSGVPFITSSGANAVWGDVNAGFNAGWFENDLWISLSASPFETNSGGHFYLKDNTLRNRGYNYLPNDTNSIQGRTTYAPIVLSSTNTTDIALGRRAIRDVDQPDLGYHYDPLDYQTTMFTMQNATLTLTNGVAISYINEAGIWLDTGAGIYCAGSPTQPNRFVDYRVVQEQPVTVGTGQPNTIINVRLNGSADGPGTFKLTEFRRLSGGATQGYDLYLFSGSNWKYSHLTVKDCYFESGNIQFFGSSACTIGMTNNLFCGSAIYGLGEMEFSFLNNLVYRGSVDLECDRTPGWLFRDNAFDSARVGDDWGFTPIVHDHNAFINTTPTFLETDPTDITLASFQYTTGALGPFYQSSTSLLNMGSRSASAAGLYHYTVKASNAKDGAETPATVDIGFHYVAVGANGLPLDYDNDSLPDYLEDSNGDGVVNDATSWQLYNSLNGLTTGNGLRVYTPLK